MMRDVLAPPQRRAAAAARAKPARGIATRPVVKMLRVDHARLRRSGPYAFATILNVISKITERLERNRDIFVPRSHLRRPALMQARTSKRYVLKHPGLGRRKPDNSCKIHCKCIKWKVLATTSEVLVPR